MLPTLTPEYVFQNAKVFTLGVEGAPEKDNAKPAQRTFQEYGKINFQSTKFHNRRIMFANMCQSINTTNASIFS